MVVFNKTKNTFKNCSRSWYLGTEQIQETENYVHLGINKYLNNDVNVAKACEKLRSTLLGLKSVGLHNDGLHPLMAFKVHKSVVLPRALFGCELWLQLSKSKMLQGERAHRFCIKYIQELPTFTKTDICLSLIGSIPIEFEIDKRKLSFLGQLCNLNSTHISKSIF